MNKLSQYQVTEEHDGKLALRVDGHVQVKPVNPVLAFPFSKPDEGIALVDEYSKEVLWLDTLEQLDSDSANVIAQALARREYRPVIRRIISVNTYNTPSNWWVETECGRCRFELPNEESIRRLGGARLVLSHANGMQFLIENYLELDLKSRQILARFMA